MLFFWVFFTISDSGAFFFFFFFSARMSRNRPGRRCYKILSFFAVVLSLTSPRHILLLPLQRAAAQVFCAVPLTGGHEESGEGSPGLAFPPCSCPVAPPLQFEVSRFQM